MEATFKSALEHMNQVFWNDGPERPTKYKFITKGAMMKTLPIFDNSDEKIPCISYAGSKQIMSDSQYRKALRVYRIEEVKFKYNFLCKNYPQTDFADRYINEIVKKNRVTKNLNLSEIFQKGSDVCA